MRLTIAILLCASVVQAADPVQSTNLVYGGSWSNIVGVSNGIPARATVYTNFTSSATVANINTGIANCPSNQVVLCAAGTYTMGGTLTLATTGVTLRGSTNANGAPTTIFNFTSDGGVVIGASSGWDTSDGTKFTTINVSSGVSRGSSSVVVASTPTGLSAGMIMWFSAPSSTEVTGGGFSNWLGSRPAIKVVKVLSVSGTTVTFWPPLNADYWSGTIQVSYRGAANTIHFSGIEDISLQRSGGAAESTSHWIQFVGTDQCWAKNTKTYWVAHSTYHMYLYATFGTEIRHCEFEKTTLGSDASSTYCITPQDSGSMLIVDNYFHTIPNVMPCFGVEGSVFAYNYINDLPYSTVSPEFLSQIVYFHGSHNAYNLFEGNWVAAHYHDTTPGSRNNIFFRERIIGWDATPLPDGKTSNTQCIETESHHDYMVVAGCVMGKVGYHTVYSGGGNAIFDFDATSASTLDKIHNYNVKDAGVNASEALGGGEALVTSYLYPTQPSFAHFWPAFDPGYFTTANNSTNLANATNLLAAAFRGLSVDGGKDPDWAAAQGGSTVINTSSLSGGTKGLSVSGNLSIR